jgi:hypothetical protein
VVPGGDGQAVGADLVGDIAVRGDPVGADEHAVDQPARHRGGGRGIGLDAVGDGGLGELPRRQPGALEQRARLVDEDFFDEPAFVQVPDDPERAAPPDGRQPPG